MKRTVTQQRLKELFTYDSATGKFERLASKRKVGTTNYKGYIRISVDNKQYMAHRLAWLYMHGRFPERMIDHINGIRHDNRSCNLREAGPEQQQQNIGITKKNKSGYLGVRFHKASQKWAAEIRSRGRKYYLGCFDTPKEASEVYNKAKCELHDFAPVVNRLSWAAMNFGGVLAR